MGTPGKNTKKDAGPERDKAPSCIFRSSGSETSRPICPRTGLPLPEDLEVGEVVPEVLCMACQLPMVLRRRRDGTAFFFGCSNFPTGRSCKFTMELDEGLAARNAARTGPKRA